MEKSKWSKAEIEQLDVKKFPTIKKAIVEGYFSASTLKINGFNANTDNVAYAYSGMSNAYVKVYKCDEALLLHLNKKLKFS